jgi:hypothetical protein
MLHKSYSGQNVDFSKAVEKVREGIGEIFPVVIMAVRKGNTDESLTYAFMYRVEDEYWDLYFDRALKIKTLTSMERVMKSLYDIYGKQSYGFLIPILCEENVLKPGQIDPEFHRLVSQTRPL